MAELTGVLFGVFNQNPLKADIRIHVYASTLHLVISNLVGHPKLPDQISHDNCGTPTNASRANHQCVAPRLHLLSYQLVCLLEMLLYGVIGHVINIQHMAHDPMLLVCQQVLCDAIHAQHEFDVMLSELRRVE